MTDLFVHIPWSLAALTLLFFTLTLPLASLRAPRWHTRLVPCRQSQSRRLVVVAAALLVVGLAGCGPAAEPIPAVSGVVTLAATDAPAVQPSGTPRAGALAYTTTPVVAADTKTPAVAAATSTPAATATPKNTPTPLPSPTNTLTPTPKPSPTPTLTPTPKPSPTPTSPPTATPLPPFRPPTGLLEDRSPGGLGELLIKNGTDADALVKLTQMNDTVVKSVYIRNAESFKMTGIPDGTYLLYYSKGEAFSKETNRFTRNATYQRLDATIEFTSSATQYTTWEVTLYGVVGGTVGSEQVDPDQFP